MDDSRLFPKIKELRLQSGYTQKYVASYLGISLSFYRKIENIDSKVIRLQMLEDLAILYHSSITYITGWEC